MNYKLSFDSSVKTLLRHLSPELKQKIKKALKEIAGNPSIGKALQEDLLGLYSYRVLRVRIIYLIDVKKKRVDVVTLGPRQSVYDELARFIKKR